MHGSTLLREGIKVIEALILILASLLVIAVIYGSYLHDDRDRLRWQLAEIERDIEAQFEPIPYGGSDTFDKAFHAGWNSALDAILWKVQDVKEWRPGHGADNG